MREFVVLWGIVVATAVSLTLLITSLQAAPTNSYNTSQTLYNADLGGTLNTQTFEYLALGQPSAGCSTPPFCPEGTQTYSATMPGTIFNSMADISDYAGYAITPTLAPTLSRVTGFKLDFRLNIVEEDHGTHDRAGFVVILLGEDMKGIEVSFWEDKIWVQDDDPLFEQAEGVAFTTTNWVNYELEIISDTYTLSANNSEILSGKVRDYTAWEPPLPGLPDPYETPNLIFFGDNTSNGRSQTWIQAITIHYNKNKYNIYLPTIIK